MARAGLGWTARDLANNAKVGYATVARFETGGSINTDSREKLATTLESAGARLSERGGRLTVSVPVSNNEAQI